MSIIPWLILGGSAVATTILLLRRFTLPAPVTGQAIRTGIRETEVLFPTLPKDVFNISVTASFRQDSAFATMPMRTLTRIDPPPMGRETLWHDAPYSKSVTLGDHLIEVIGTFKGRNFIQWLITPAPPGPVYSGNPLRLYINEDKRIVAEYQ